MKSDIHLKSWIRKDDEVLLTYSDGDTIRVRYTDFNRTFQCMVTCAKEDIRRDFAIV